MSAASEAYERLIVAMETVEPDCQGLDLFTADDISKADQDVMQPICESCPLLTLCRTYVDLAKPKAGYWAGKLHRTYKLREAS